MSPPHVESHLGRDDREVFDVDPIDARPRRALVQPLDEPGDGTFRTFGLSFDRAVRTVLHEADEPELLRGCLRVGAKRDTLHTTDDDEPDPAHE